MAFHGITFLVFVVGTLLAFFKFIDQKWKEAIWWFFGAVAFHMVPTAIDTWLQATDSGADRKWADVVGNWYGGGNAATIINHMAGVGADYGDAIWAGLAATFLPQLMLLAWGWRAYMKHQEGDKKALLIFFLVGSLIVPRIIGGPGAAAPRAVFDQGSTLMSAIVKDFSTREKESMGYTLKDIEIARRNARIPAELRPAIAVYNDMARFASVELEARPRLLTSEAYQAYQGKPISTKGVSILALRGSKEGPDGYVTMPDIDPYLESASKDPTIIVWTDEISDRTIWSRLSDGQGLLRDKAELGYKLTVYPMAGGADPSRLRNSIKAIYDYYNQRRNGKTKDELMGLIRASLETGDASQPKIDYEALDERVGQAIKANAKVVEPPEVVELSGGSLGLHEQLQLSMQAYYQRTAAKFAQWERAQYSVPNYLYDPDFYGVLLFADGFSIPLNQKDPKYADAAKMTEKKSWENLMSADGIQRDIARGYSMNGPVGSLDGEGFFDIFFAAPAWLGFKLLTSLISLGLPLVKHVVPHVAGFSFLFIMASYPVFALVSMFPGRWTALLDWAKAVLWVMSWAVCYQIGLGWTESMPVTLTVDQGSMAEGLTQNIFVLMGMFMMVAAPALTGFVLSASANALQNIGSTVMTMGFKAAGGAFVMGAVVMAAVGAAVATVLAPVVAPAAAAAAKALGVAGGAAGSAAGAGGAAAGVGGAAAKGGSLASAAASQGGMFSRFAGGAMQTLQSAVGNAKSAGNATAGLASMGLQRWDAFMGTGAGTGANAAGPVAPDERWSKRGGGAGGAGSPGGSPPPGAVTISRGGGAGGGESLLPAAPTTRRSPAVGTSSAADAHDSALAGTESPSKGQLSKAELLHSQAANFAGNPGRAAVSSSMAAEAASLTGSKSTGTRIAQAEKAVGAAVSAASDPGASTSAHLAGARTQMAKARHLSESGDSVGASVAQQAAGAHLQSAASSCIQSISVAGANGDDSGRIQHVSALAGIGSAAQSLQSQSSGPAAAACGTVVAQVSAALHATGQAGGASGEAAKGFTSLMAGNGQAADTHFRSASSQAGGEAKQAMLSAAIASSGSVSISGVVQTVAAQLSPGKGLAANAYDRPEAPAKT